MQPEYLDRLFHPRMEFYREIYKNSPRWDGIDSVEGKDIVVYCEQGYGDIIQFARYIPYLKQLGCRVHMHLPVPLHDLFYECLTGVDSVYDKELTEIPPHDYHTLTMSLPFVLGLVDVDVPYLHVEEGLRLEGRKFRIGIAWEGNPNHSNNGERCCPLALFRKIHDLPDVELYTIQQCIHDPKLVSGCEDFELYGAELRSFKDTAKLIKSMDLIVSVDTSVLHLAGAMGKKTVALLGKNKDPRWDSGVNWYPTMKYIEQTIPGDWVSVAKQLLTFVSMERTKWTFTHPAQS